LESSSNCVYDRVEVFNGPSPNHPALGKFCGPFRPSNVKSTSNRMLIQFSSDDSTQKTGFMAIFLSIAPVLASKDHIKHVFLAYVKKK